MFTVYDQEARVNVKRVRHLATVHCVYPNLAAENYDEVPHLRVFSVERFERFCFFLLFLQNSVFEWARDHRVHHKYTETNADPHNAKRGFFFSHVGWLLCRKHPDVIEKGKQIDMSDLYEDPLIAFQKKYVDERARYLRCECVEGGNFHDNFLYVHSQVLPVFDADILLRAANHRTNVLLG